MSFTSIILAAGHGSRISRITDDPKVLLPMGGGSILSRHLSIFDQLGLRQVVLVVGYRKEKILTAARPFHERLKIMPVANDDFASKGNGYSLYLGIRSVTGPVLIFDGDLVYSQAILQRFVEDSHPSAVLTGKGSLDDIECAKVLVDDRNYVRKTVDKRALSEAELQQFRFGGEAIGVLKFSESDRRELVGLCEEFFKVPENLPLNWEHLMSRFFVRHDVWRHQEDSEDWVEIDTPEDYEVAQSKMKVVDR